MPGSGEGVDRTLIRSMLRRTPAERFDTVPAEAEWLHAVESARRV
jgi:hypothetical protein